LTLNVVRSGAAIKGGALARHGKLSLEQLIGGGSVFVDVGHMLLDADDFGLQSFDTLGELILRHWSQILLHEQGQWIAGPGGEEIVVIHGGKQR
jgi:hypothetical protein